jgi:nucleotide-binding universal stress UspA family protein
MSASRILIGHDGSPHADDALALGRVLSELTGAELILARVVPWEPLTLQAVPVPELKRRYEEEERNALSQLQEAADRVGAGAEAGPGESPAQGLQLLSEELEPDIVVVGSSHRGRAGQVLAGNIGLRLLSGLDRSLAVAPAGYAAAPHGLRTIGVGFDGSPESRAALQMAGELAQAGDAAVRVIGVTEPIATLTAHPWAFGWAPGTGAERYAERARGDLESAAGGLPTGVERSTEVHVGGPATILTDQARELDLLVLGSRGYGPVRRVLIGSVSSELVRGAPCPVLVVPRPDVGRPDDRPDRVEGAAQA